MRPRVWHILILLSLFISIFRMPARAEALPRVHLSPAVVKVGAGETAAVEVRVENISDLYGFDIRLGFDPQVVEVVDADPATDGVQVRPGDLLSLDLVIRNVADNEGGLVWYAVTQVNPSEPVTGHGTAFTLILRGKNAGAVSPLSFDYHKMASRAGNEIEAQTEDGQIEVVGAAEAPPTPTPAPPPEQPTLVLPTYVPPPTPTMTPTGQPVMAQAVVEPTPTTAQVAGEVRTAAEETPAPERETPIDEIDEEAEPGPLATETPAVIAALSSDEGSSTPMDEAVRVEQEERKEPAAKAPGAETAGSESLGGGILTLALVAGAGAGLLGMMILAFLVGRRTWRQSVSEGRHDR